MPDLTKPVPKAGANLQAPLTIAETLVKPGERAAIDIPVARLYTHTNIAIPAHVIHGRGEGPRLFVCGAIHGDEIIGTEIIRRLIKLKKIQKLRGTLIVVPAVNVYAFLQHSRYSPDRRDLNRFFPGSKKGSLTSQLADRFMKEVVANSQYGIDLHAGSNYRANLPQIRADISDPETLRLAKAFQVPVVIKSATRKGSLRHAASKKGIRMLLYEAGEALRLDEEAVKAGVRGIVSVMTALEMLPPSKRRTSDIDPLIAEATTWVRAPASGILHMKSPLGSKVAKNDRIGVIADPFGEEEIEIRSPVAGIAVGRLNLPLVHRGDAIIHIAKLNRLKEIEPIVEEFREEIIEAP